MLVSALRHVLELLPSAYHRVGSAGDILHASMGMGVGKRGLLLSLQHAGPHSVSQLASMRPVSRQFVQRLVDEMVAGGWVEANPNPRHSRSPLISLTETGRGAIAAMQEAEEPYLLALSEGMDPDELAIAARVLAAIAKRVSPNALEQLARGVTPVLALEASDA